MPTNHETIAAHYRASAAGDLTGMLAPVTPTTRWTEAVGSVCAGTYVGPDEVRTQVFQRIAATFDGFRFTLDELIDAGDAQIAVGTYDGTVRADGRPFQTRAVHVWRFDAGRLIAFEQFADPTVWP